MATFKDKQGTDWLIELDPFLVGDVHKHTGVSLYEAFDDNAALLAQLGKDSPLLATVLYWLCKEQIDELKLSQREFGKRLVGDPLEAGLMALLEELADFFPDSRRRAAIRRMIEAASKVNEQLLAELTTTLGSMNTDALAASAVASIKRSAASSRSAGQPESASPAE